LEHFAAKDTTLFPSNERIVGDLVKQYTEDRRAKRLYGMLNFGDWYGPSGDVWANGEYDNAYGLLLEFLRGGDERLFAFAGRRLNT